MKKGYVRIETQNIREMEIAIPVVVKINGEDYTQLMKGKIDWNSKKVPKDEAVEER